MKKGKSSLGHVGLIICNSSLAVSDLGADSFGGSSLVR
jgi:hypothetical protein